MLLHSTVNVLVRHVRKVISRKFLVLERGKKA
uniref:Uncharacterized protein n=1 Tax=Rhizophora mucronata TaxID=61149 RepID=A0A2P2QU12_RHIMU